MMSSRAILQPEGGRILLILSNLTLVSPVPVLGVMPRSTCVTGGHSTNYPGPRYEYPGPHVSFLPRKRAPLYFFTIDNQYRERMMLLYDNLVKSQSL
ncbi:hypothetical protein BGW80DRAFT_1315173 [Lactifluus volemus]|nr:hypothetical protein BGW80DRAFT_1315173 [Lactifluus volemus]